MTKIRTYSELMEIPSIIDRYLYLKLDSKIGDRTFGGYRYLNQMFYTSSEWRAIRRDVILRDQGCDLAHPDHPISGLIMVHHMNPITKDDILERSDFLLNPEYLISTSKSTHLAIDYGDESLLIFDTVLDREAGDTILW